MSTFSLAQASSEELDALHANLKSEYEQLKSANLNLDLTRGKPSADQLSLSNALDGILAGDYQSISGTDIRNYGGLDGLPEAKALFAQVLNVDSNELLIGGNSSLTLMYQSVLFALLFGLNENSKPWKTEGNVKFLCPVPGYDRHFSICEELDIEMIPVAMNSYGPDMDAVEALVANDKSIKGMWCVPRFSNPTGIVYSDETVERIAKLGNIAADNFCVFWDNAYAIHSLHDNAPALAPISNYCKQYGTEDNVIQFGSSSKVTFAGAGVAFLATSARNLAAMKQHLGISSIGPDKVNQLRHVKFFENMWGLNKHMQKHADLLTPRFAIVLDKLQQSFENGELLSWEKPEGGYFVSVDTNKGLATKVIALASELGVKLTPAGATFPYGNDPDDKNIRLAPSFPTLEDIDAAMDVFVLCVKLATLEQAR